VGQLASMAVAQFVRSGQLVILLPEQAVDHRGVYVYYGSRKAQPRRVRAFLDLVVKRLGEAGQYVLTAAELQKYTARTRARKAKGRR
jgi:DNA-binding transcriptional LysR family regulator